MKVKIFLIFAAAVSLLFAAVNANTVLAQTTSGIEQIDSFHDDILINKDGTINVIETINYDFGDEYHHGIYRTIPYTKVDESTNKKYKLNFDINSVTDENGKNYKYTTSSEDDILEVKIGDANRTINGKHTYILNYTVSGALGYFDKQDELYWNVTGTEWMIPIGSASATITLPQDVEQINMLCYTGYHGANDTNCNYSSNSKSVTYATTVPLNSSQGLTVVMGFPKGTVAVRAPEEVIAFTDTWYGKIVFFVSLILMAVLFLLWYLFYPLWIIIKWFKYGRDPKSMTPKVSAWFEAPKLEKGRVLRPGEIGTLVDETADFQDISATIVDLARRGNFKIEERKKDDFYFIKSAEFMTDPYLLEYEKALLVGIFGGSSEVRIKDKKLYKTIEDVKTKLYEVTVEEGFFPENPDKTRSFYNGMIVAALFTANFPLFISALIFGRSLTRRTEKGVAATNISLSLKNFLSTQERQLAFQAKNQMMFEKMLPYAVAFGVEKIWAERFKDIKLKEPDWYQGYDSTRFSSHIFIHNLNSSFSRVQSAATPPPSSSTSSGFSGGSSGGGGGGGGGGSW